MTDWRYEELRRLGGRERELARELAETRREVARLIKELLPQHSSKDRINEVVEASGYSRALVEAVRGGQDMWTRP